MTCIVGLKHKGKVYIGADSAGVNAHWQLSVRKDQKVFRKGAFLFGCAGSYRMTQLLQHKLGIPGRDPARDLSAYMACEFIDAVRTCLREGGHQEKRNEQESLDGQFLVAHAQRLFAIEADYQVGEVANDYNAAGCAEDIALGAMYATGSTTRLNPEDRVILALEAAEQFSAGVRAPFTVMVI